MNARRLLVSLAAAVATLFAYAPTAIAQDGAKPTVLITGSNRGIGLALAQGYAERGWNVIATTRDPSDAEELQALADKHPGVTIEALDVTDFAEIDALAAKYRGRPIDVLLNNAGISGGVPAQIFGRMDYDVFRTVFEVNTVGPMKLSEALIENVLASDQKKIVTISTSEASFAGVDAGRLYWYRSTKAAVNMLMLNLAHGLAKKGVAVALINPGPVDTDLMKGVKMELQEPDEAAGKILGIIDEVSVETTGRFWDYDGGYVAW